MKAEFANSVAGLDSWLDTMRCESGYGGPVLDWQQQCLQYTGVGRDWRYEGIVGGYLNLYRATAADKWLAKAKQAGDDLVAGQDEAGNFAASSFALNPNPASSRHEAAADVALLELVAAGEGDYLEVAAKNLEDFFLNQLWDDKARAFKVSTAEVSFWPDQLCTLSQALLLWHDAGGPAIAEEKAYDALEFVLSCQVQHVTGSFDGAIYYKVTPGQEVARFFPFYVARCIPALLDAYTRSRRPRYWNAAKRAKDFLLRQMDSEGRWPQVVYDRKRTNRYPVWLAGSAEIARALSLFTGDKQAQTAAAKITDRLLAAQSPTGAVRTAEGFANQLSQAKRFSNTPDFRDLLPVAGWCDKAFHYLSAECDQMPDFTPQPYEQECLFYGQRALFQEDDTSVTVLDHKNGNLVLYQWRKGHPWANPTNTLLYR